MIRSQASRQGSSVGITLNDPELEESVRAALEFIEAELRDAVAANDPLLAEASRHLLDAGGKRFRPLLVALAARFGDSGARP